MASVKLCHMLYISGERDQDHTNLLKIKIGDLPYVFFLIGLEGCF